MAGRSQCRQCTAAVPVGANFCVNCGATIAPLVVDLLRVDEPPLPSGSDVTPHPRRGLWAVLALFAGMMLVLWSLTRGVERPDDQPLGAEIPEEAIAAKTTGAQTTTSEQKFVNDVSGPVLGHDVDGVLVQTAGLTMRQIDLSTGAIERIDLEHHVFFDGPDSGIVVDGKLIAIRRTSIIVTDLSDGSQDEPRAITDGSFEVHVAGRAGVDSVWLANYLEPDQASEAIEVDVEGEVRSRVLVPRPFEIRWAEGHELILDSPDGSFHYNVATGAIVRMPGQVVAFERALVITTSCDESLQCDVLADRGNGPLVVDWLSASDDFDGPIDLSPDLSGALLHTYTQRGAEHTFIDLHTGSRVDLGSLRIDPYRGVVWVEGSRWIIGRNASPNLTLAVNTETGAQVELELGTVDFSSQSFLTFIPSN